jgi:hypothetical protein
MPVETYQGSCRCGAVRFEADIDPSLGTTKCNCTSCWKLRLWSVSVAPDAFRPLAGEAALSDYKPGQIGGHGGFCRHCGTHMYGFVPANDWNPAARVSISVAVLDDLDPLDLIAAPVTHCDGRNDNWWQPPAEVRHL